MRGPFGETPTTLVIRDLAQAALLVGFAAVVAMIFGQLWIVLLGLLLGFGTMNAGTGNDS